jgi:hypothetical protein
MCLDELSWKKSMQLLNNAWCWLNCVCKGNNTVSDQQVGIVQGTVCQILMVLCQLNNLGRNSIDFLNIVLSWINCVREVNSAVLDHHAEAGGVQGTVCQILMVLHEQSQKK